ncbi:hypothetical protein SNE25_24900 [Mucilaginibacter sabulilitoris]|uniref:Glyoxalase n=1 Tax=Mucilaginibacter sabulilitoris TaxID=1173583 RepID=A0ABZ0TID0_9SPHI|nr:hypothetical protein [Mucilaginibacter sabulilitoris]WPU92566.1 hypothetical protein SNE25_24900 [Mucilaginibacter sabulilitoris]
MSLLKIIPKVIYDDINTGIRFFTALGFEVKYAENDFCIMARDGVTIQLIASEENFIIGDRPEFRIETDDIEGYYAEIKAQNPEILHPNLNVIKHQPWGLTEFAVSDETSVCIIIQQR